MIDWEWESFEAFITPDSYVFTDPGPLFAPIKTFSIKRNAELDLILETKCLIDAKSGAVEHPIGTVRLNEDTATLASVTGETTVTLIGVQPHRYERTHLMREPGGEARETASLSKLVGQTKNINPPIYIIDWISNVSSSFHWPDTTDEVETTTKTFTLGIGENAPTMTDTGKRSSGSRNCAKLNVDGQEVFLCHLDRCHKTEIKSPGFILYTGMPSDDIREKIRIILSFLLGTYFVHLGHSVFCKDWRLVSYEVISAYALGGMAYELPPCPPAPLGKRWEREIDGTILSRMASALYSHYDALHFRSLHWAIWHALSAVSHIAPVHYGAAIEALQRAYVKNNKASFNTKLLADEPWNSIRQIAEKAANALPLEPNIRDILTRKISELNNKPADVLMVEILNNLGLSLSQNERKAWKYRNYASHGIHTKPENSAQDIRETKMLWLRFNRMLFAITGASDVYYDYYSFGRPTRKVTDEIP